MTPAIATAAHAAPPRGTRPAIERMQVAAQQRDATRFAAASARFRQSKCWLALLLGFLFWFSVPYSLPRHLPSIEAGAQVTDNAEQFEGAISRQIAVPILGLCACFMLWRYPIRGVLGGRLFIVVCLYVAWVVSSVIWSEDPQLSAKRLVVFALDCLFTYALARTLSTMEMALGAFVAMLVTALASLFADVFLLHIFQPGNSDYRLTGVMTPNHNAMNLVSCALCGVALMLRRPRWLPWLSAALTITLALLWITRARIGTILCFLLLAIALNKVLRDRARPHVRTAVVLLMLLLTAPMLLFLFGSDVGGAAQSAFMMGRNDTENTSNLSNRLPLWQELMDSVEQHPILGFGYGAFWTEERAARISKDQGWAVPHAHNGYLDQTIVLGIIGGSLYLVIMVSALVVAWRRYRRIPSSGNLLNAMLLTWLVLLNTSESAPLDPHMPTILVYAAVLRMCLREGSVDTADPVPDRHIVEGLAPPTSLPPPSHRPQTPLQLHGNAAAGTLPAGQWRTPVLSPAARRPA